MFRMTRHVGVGVALVAGIGIVAAVAIQGGWLEAAMTLLVALGGAAFVVGVVAASRGPSHRVHAEESERPDHSLLLH